MTLAWSRKFSRRSNPEDVLHVAVARYLHMALPVDAYWTTLPTGNLSVTQGARMKAKGYRRGSPDLVICWGGRAYWIELKAPKGVVDPIQREAHAALARAGAKVGIARDLNDVQAWLQEWRMPIRAVVDPRQLSGARQIA